MNNSQEYEVVRLTKLRNHRKVLDEVKALIRRIDPESRIIFFGSVLRGNTMPGAI